MNGVPALSPNVLAKGLTSAGKGFFHFSASQIVAGILFGIIGGYILRSGKRNTNFSHLFIGIGLMAYPYFVSNTVAMWGIGIGLTVLAWQQR